MSDTNDTKTEQKIETVKSRLMDAFGEYSANWTVIDGTLDASDLIGFLGEWTEEIEKKEATDRAGILYELVNLTSNLDIQRDFLRVKKGWMPNKSAEPVEPFKKTISVILKL